MHMAFLSRGFKNLQWYSMTNKKDACRRLFYLVDLGERKPSYKGEAPVLILRDGGTAMVPPSHIPLLAVGRSGVLFGDFFIWRALGNTGFPVRLCPFILPFRRQPAFTHQPDQIEDTPDAQLQAHGGPYAGQPPAGRGQPRQREPNPPHGSQIE